MTRPSSSVPLRIIQTAVTDGDAIEVRIQRELVNDNAGNRNRHWSAKHRRRRMWQAALTNAIIDGLGLQRALQLLTPESGLLGARGPREAVRRRLSITRVVPSARNFVRDEFENLPWCAKELRDAVKNVGLIYDDSSKWTDTMIRQAVSEDGQFWTIVRIEPAETVTP